MTDTLELAVHSFRAPEAATDSTQTFLQLVHDMCDGHLQIPEHQRTPDAWDEKKQARYLDRLRQAVRGCHPPGSIATYQLVGTDNGITVARSATFLNDGLQRLTALRKLLAQPGHFDMDADGADALLRLKISVQHRHYASHHDAMRDFQFINDGTHLTSFELCRGYLTYMKDWKPLWAPLVAEIEGAVNDSAARLTERVRAEQDRNGEHKRRRDNLALFHRFLTGDRTHSPYPDIGARDIGKYLDKDSVVEQRLAKTLTEMGRDEVASRAKKFQVFVAAETALIETCVQKLLGSGSALSATNHRWLLHLAIWRRNSEVSRQRHQAFIEVYLKETHGKSLWIGPQGHQVTLGLAHLGLLPTLAEWAGMPEFCERQRRARAAPPAGLRQQSR